MIDPNTAVPILRLSQGNYIGCLEDGVQAFRGIPYASYERFASPTLHDASNYDARSVSSQSKNLNIDATKPGPVCPQPPSALERVMGPMLDSGPQSEMGCNVLSIFRSDTSSAKLCKLPIMVYVHGGAFITGSSQAGWSEGCQLAKEGVISISISYRLGLFGFLYNESDLAQGKLDLGTQDVVAALEWVKDNAHALGGDPSNVCAYGQSAGAYLIQMLLDERPELFRRAIIQSSPCSEYRTPELAKQLREIAQNALPAGKTFVTATTDDLLHAQVVSGRAAMEMGSRTACRPVCYHSSPWGGRNKRKPKQDIMIGWTIDDHLIYLELSLERQGIPAEEHVQYLSQVERLTEETWGSPSRELATRLRALGDNVITYRFEWRPEGSRFGATHTSELPLLHGNAASWDSAPMLGTVPYTEWHERGKAIRKVWTQFAKDGTMPTKADGFTFGL